MKIHVLTGDGIAYSVVIHAPVPAGNNLAGVPWSTAIQNSGKNTSVLPTGNGPGQIAAAELAQIQAGTLVEAVLSFGDNPSWTQAERIAELDRQASRLVQDTLNRLQDELKYFGATRA